MTKYYIVTEAAAVKPIKNLATAQKKQIKNRPFPD